MWPGERKPEIILPDWLKPRTPVLVPPPESKDLQIAQYEVVFPRVLDNICRGDTLARAVRELPIEINSGTFFRWIKKDPKRFELYQEAKVVQAEVYAGRLVDIAEGIGENSSDLPEDVARSRLNFDIYKWLMERNSRKAYGDVKTIEVDGQISITSAIEEARKRAMTVIDVEAEELTDSTMLSLPSASPFAHNKDESEDSDD